MLRLYAMLMLGAALVGCATPPKPMYAWGSYEQLIYSNHATPGAGDAQSQIASLEKDYQAARGANQRLPPGWHAQLGYLYYQIGKSDQARQEFMTEKAEFPESAVFVDRLIARLKQP